MKTEVFIMEEDSIDVKGIKRGAEIINNGGLVAFPTETVYGLGANALDEEAVKKIFIAKGRPQDNPLIVHVNKKEDIYNLTQDISEVAKKIIDEFFPGPITVILNKSTCIPNVTSAGLDTIGIRMPKNEIALKIIEESGVPIAAPSANISGRPSPTDVKRCVEDLNGRVECIIGGNNSIVGVESTIVDCTVEPPCILRPGKVTLEELKGVCEEIYIDPAIMKKPSETLKPKAPGMKYRHYAPNAQVKIIKGNLDKTIAKINEMLLNYIDEDKTVGILATDETKENYKEGIVFSLGSRTDLNVIAKNLFETLRTLDDQKVDIILSEAFDEVGVGVAIMNRLNKSAGFDIIEV